MVDLSALCKVVDEFVDAVNRHLWSIGHGDDDAGDHRQEAVRLLPSLQAIARRIPEAPPPEDFQLAGGWDIGPLLDPALQLRGAIDVQMTLVEALETPAPKLTHEILHPWVWGAAQALWETGHFRNAVHAAATMLDEHLQAKLGRSDLTGTALAREAFSISDPRPGRPRLRLDEKLNDEMFKSLHEGAMHFAEGCFMLIRNAAAHRTSRLKERSAIEQLAALSYLARLIEVTVVVHAPGVEKEQRLQG